MSEFFSSGSDAVDKMGQLHLTGDVIPKIWYNQIRTEKGKPYYLAVTILADIVYWYRPEEIRDEYTGHIIGWRKKFAYDMLQRSYSELMKNYGESRKTIQRALETLEAIGVIKRRLRKLEFKDGSVLHNVLFLELIPEVLKQITYPEEEQVVVKPYRDYDSNNHGRAVKITDESSETSSDSEATLDCDQDVIETADTVTEPETRGYQEGGMVKFDHTYGQKSPYLRSEESVPMVKFDHTSGQNCPYPWTDMTVPLDKYDHTNTENTTEITTENYLSIYPVNPDRHNMVSGMDRYDTYRKQSDTLTVKDYMAMIRENIDYDAMISSLPVAERDLYEELYHIICDVVCVQREKIRVDQEDYPYAIVKSRYLKLNSSHLLYVIDCMKKTTRPITSIRKYMVTSLYNAPSTMNHYYTAVVNHDMAEGLV